MQTQVRAQVRRFYDGGLPAIGDRPAVPPDPSADPRIVLERHSEDGVESFALDRRIAYADRHLGELLVPASTVDFRTDLTSVPALFTWLVPKTGAHLPAALLHDGLVHPGEPATYVATRGVVVDRVTADRIFRDAMADTGTGVVRRWLVWSAVTSVTLLSGRGTGWSAARVWWHRTVVVLTVGIIAWLGACATVDLFDASLPGLPALPWMGDRPWPLELVGGLAAAVVIPMVLGLAWGRFFAAGAILGIGLAVLLHVTVVLLALTGLYQVVERVADRRPTLSLLLAGAIVAGSAVLACWLAVGG